jgi:hypothetical protein
MALSIKIMVYLEVTPCRLVVSNFSEEPAVPFSGESTVNLSAAGSSETSVTVYQIAQGHIPEDCVDHDHIR